MIASDYTSFKNLSVAKEIFIRETERKKNTRLRLFWFLL